jgi:hypothetical protein
MTALPLTMFDSVTATDIPIDAPMVSGYGDEQVNRYRWSAQDWARFPNAVKLVTVISAATDDGDELDIETGDATPAQAPEWVRLRVAAGRSKVSLYMNRSTWPAVQQAVNAAGLADRVVYRVAQYTGTPFTLPGAWAVQYADPATSGGHYDLSYVVDLSWFGIAPAPPVFPASQEDSTVAHIAHPNGARFDLIIVGTDNGVYQSAAPTFDGLASLPGGRVGGPAVTAKRIGGVSWTPDGKTMNLSIQGTDDHPYLLSMDITGGWGAPVQVSKQTVLGEPVPSGAPVDPASIAKQVAARLSAALGTV